MNVGLIGNGYWGKILYEKLKDISNIVFVCNSSDDYFNRLSEVEWVFIATPNETHYTIVRDCLYSNTNVFCEKPLTLSYKRSTELFNLADSMDVKLYVDDVFNYRVETVDLQKLLQIDDYINVKWHAPRNNFIYDLFYHDCYLLYPLLKDNINIQWPKINNILFDYKYSDTIIHYINDINLAHNPYDIDALSLMIKCVLSDKVDYVQNREISLNTNKIIDMIGDL
jgi:predicted dehydrogenase